ncbi:MAG: cation:proton antiporter [Elusimicrobia bacterium]|nr:cation:proton antiporter [Elusimicrobiota bacterium]
MRKLVSIILLGALAFGLVQAVKKIPFGVQKTKVGKYYVERGIEDTGSSNIVTSVVLNYRGFDTLGEVTILFAGAIALGAVLFTGKKRIEREVYPASPILSTACKFLFPLILLFGAYIFIHGHLTPGGGFQGGAIAASALLLIFLGCPGRKTDGRKTRLMESLGGIIFVLAGLLGLAYGGFFLFNFLPKGTVNNLFSAGIIPVLYIVIGFKVASEIAGILDNLFGETE